MPHRMILRQRRVGCQDVRRRRGDELSAVALAGGEQRARAEAWFRRERLERGEDVGGDHGLAVGMLYGEGAALKPTKKQECLCLSMMSSLKRRFNAKGLGGMQGTSGHGIGAGGREKTQIRR
jgi:hypothetical protein